MNSGGLTPFAGFLCPLFFIGIFVVAIIMTIRLARARKGAPGGSGVSAPPPVNVPTQLAQDGFWITSCPADPGSIIYYHYWTAGARYSGQVPFKPEADGRQFVYTGRGPDQVSISRIALIPPIIIAGSTWDPSDSSSAPSSPPASSSSSFPSAY
jgi:hypothetical protein